VRDAPHPGFPYIFERLAAFGRAIYAPIARQSDHWRRLAVAHWAGLWAMERLAGAAGHRAAWQLGVHPHLFTCKP